MCLGVWLTRRLAGERAHCCPLRRRDDDLVGAAPVCHPASRRPGTGPHLCGNPTRPPCGAHAISACGEAILLCAPVCRGGVWTAGTCPHQCDTRARHVCMGQSPHLVVGLQRYPRSCGPPGLRTFGDRLCWGCFVGPGRPPEAIESAVRRVRRSCTVPSAGIPTAASSTVVRPTTARRSAGAASALTAPVVSRPWRRARSWWSSGPASPSPSAVPR
jgi:hypothetical protein